MLDETQIGKAPDVENLKKLINKKNEEIQNQISSIKKKNDKAEDNLQKLRERERIENPDAPPEMSVDEIIENKKKQQEDEKALE